MSFLSLERRRVLVFGVANRKSVAHAIGRVLTEEGAEVVYAVRSEKRRLEMGKLLPGAPVFVCDVEDEGALARLATEVSIQGGGRPLHGLVHSIAFANYASGMRRFSDTARADFMQATAISAFSLVEMARAFRDQLAEDASVVSIGISSLQVTPDNYGYMGPVKAALDSASRFLAKDFSAHSKVRFNVVGAGPLKTSASAGIPGYLESFLYAEKMTLRRAALSTDEVARAAVFLLSPASSGINGSTLTVDAGLGQNFFDREIVRLAMRPERPAPQA